MSMTRYCVIVDDVEKELFKIRESKNADNADFFDLNISFKGLNQSRISKSGETLSDLFIEGDYSKYIQTHKGSHITVHCNPSHDTITIKRSLLDTSSQMLQSSVQVVDIKTGHFFVPIIFRVCGSMSDACYNVKSCKNDEYVWFKVPVKTAKDQLRYMIAVSWGNNPLPVIDEHPSHVISTAYKNFTITVIYSFLNVRTEHQNLTFSLQTNPTAESTPRGLDFCGLYNFYTDINMAHAMPYLEYLKSNN